MTRRGEAARGPRATAPAATPAQSAARGPRGRTAIEFAAALAATYALTLAAFWPARDAAFVSDDINAIVENEWVHGPFDPMGIVGHYSWWGLGRSDAPGYRPAATISFALNHRLGGPTPRSFRDGNFALNALCAALLFALARSLGLGLAPSGAAAALFAVLPIHSEAVIWLVGRTELGAAAAFLTAALACVAHRRSGSRAALLAAATAVGLGIAFKENAVTALAIPAALWLATERDRALLGRDVASTAAMAAGAAACLLLRSQADGFALAGEPVSQLDNPLSVLDPVSRWLGALAVLGRYAALTVWPSRLSVDYSFDALGIRPGFVASGDSAAGLALLALAAVVAWRGPGRRDVATLGLLLAAASYSIVSNTVFVLGTILGERLFYLPSAGLLLAAAATAGPWLGEGTPARRRPGLQGRAGFAALAGTAALVVASVAVDRARAAEWRTPVSLFESAVRAVPRSARAQMELASAYGNAGRTQEALVHFDLALAVKPDYASALYNRGNALARAGRLEEAAQSYRRTLAIQPRFARAWNNLALAEQMLGRPEGRLAALRAGVEASPESTALRADLASALLAAGRHDEALPHYDALLATGDAPAVLWFYRGVARQRVGGCSAAVDDYVRAVRAVDAPREALVAATSCLRQLGRSQEADELEHSGQVANRGTRR